MPELVIVADDLTGAMDTGYAFTANDHTVRISLREPHSPVPDDPSRRSETVLAIDADTRHRTPARAAAAIAELLENVDLGEIPSLYKKIDSTLRGNIVAELDAAIAATDVDVAVVAPSFPSTGRTVKHGIHRVDGVELEDTAYGVSTSNLTTLFSSSAYDVVSLGLETVTAGVDAVRSEIASYTATRDEPFVAVCDAVTDRQLHTIAVGVDEASSRVLYVGSGGLANAISIDDETGSAVNASRRSTTAEQSRSAVLGIVGSTTDQTFAGLETVDDEHVEAIDPAAAVRDPDRAGTNAASAVTDRLHDTGRAVVTGATSPSDVERASASAASLEVDAGSQIERALATVAEGVVTQELSVDLFVTGGSVARSVLEQLSVTSIDLTGRTVAAGIPEGRLVDGDAAGSRLVTKAGGFGDETSIVNCLDFLSEPNARN